MVRWLPWTFFCGRRRYDTEQREPVRVQALRPEAPVERLDERIVGRLPGSEKSNVTSCSYAHRSSCRLMNSEPWSTRIAVG
jgi:hypothetical protein